MMVAESKLLTHDNMAMQLTNVITKDTREIALPPGLTQDEVVAYVKKWMSPNEEMTGVYEYK